MVRFDVSTLVHARRGESLDLIVDTGPQCLDDLEVSYLRGKLSAIRVQDGIFIQGTIKSQLRLECVRCLSPFEFPLGLNVEETFRLPGTSSKPDQPYSVSEAGVLDLVPALRETIWLNIPIKPVCAPPCKGLCAQCGANLNVESCTCERDQIDPRLIVLKDLLKD